MTSSTPRNLPFPEFIDNTFRSMFAHCPQKWIYGAVHAIGPKDTSIHLHAGGAFASGLEFARKAFFDENRPVAESIKIGVAAFLEAWGDFPDPEDGNKTRERMLDALLEYFQEYPLDANPVKPIKTFDGKHAIEFTFSVPLPIKHPVTGNPLLYQGRFDMLAAYNDANFAVDEKTASQLGAQWQNQWDLDSQFTGYCWAAKQFGYPVAGAIIRGISILKTKFGHAQALIYRPDWQLDRWYENLLWDINQMILFWERYNDGKFVPMAIDKAICGQYGGCAYRRLCMSPNPIQWIEADFAPRTWNPCAKGA